MKKVIGIVYCVLLASILIGAPAEVTLTMLKDASVAEGKEYLNQCDTIIKKASVGKAEKEWPSPETTSAVLQLYSPANTVMEELINE